MLGRSWAAKGLRVLYLGGRVFAVGAEVVRGRQGGQLGWTPAPTPNRTNRGSEKPITINTGVK